MASKTKVSTTASTEPDQAELREQTQRRLRKLRDDLVRAQMMPDMEDGSLKNLAKLEKRVTDCERELAELYE